MIHVVTKTDTTKIADLSNTLQFAYVDFKPWSDCIILTDAEGDQIQINQALIPDLIKQLQAFYEKPKPAQEKP